MNVNARYPGNTHDSYVWNNTNVLPIMWELYNRRHGFYLLGAYLYCMCIFMGDFANY